MEVKKIINIKEILNEIILEENQRYHLEVYGYYIKIIEYYKILLKMKKIKLDNLNDAIYRILLPIRTYGWYSLEEKNIIIIIKSLKESFDINKTSDLLNLIKIIRTTYHEIRHCYQTEIQSKKDDYESLLLIMERIIVKYDKNYYQNNYINFFSEIDAHIYSVEKTKEYLDKKNIKNKKITKYLLEKEKEYIRYYSEYNQKEILEKFNLIIKNNSIDLLEKNNILKIFYKNDGNYKPLIEILNNENFYKLDTKIINFFLINTSYIDQLNTKVLKEQQRKIIINSLKEAKQEYEQHILCSEPKEFNIKKRNL